MKLTIALLVTAAVITLGATSAMAIEETAYTVATGDGAFELRDYAPHVVAETLVEGSIEKASKEAFSRLFGYISGGNRTRQKVAMTAPVSQELKGEKIAMTAPVSQQRAGVRWAVSFAMPASYTLDTLPAPEDPLVTLRQVPARRMAAVRYSGFWSEAGYRRHLEKLESWMRGKGLAAAGAPVWARYNSPFSLWFLRRNEVLVPVATGAE